MRKTSDRFATYFDPQVRGSRPRAPDARGHSASAGVAAALPSSLIKHDTLKGIESSIVIQLSAPDRRVDPKTGSFLTGTYAFPASEVPSRFSALSFVDAPGIRWLVHKDFEELGDGVPMLD